MKRKYALTALLLLAIFLLGCGEENVVYVDPNRVEEREEEAEDKEEEREEEAEKTELTFQSGDLILLPLMEAEDALEALGQPLGAFEADSCAYQGKDYYYYYPGFELTVNEVEGERLVTAITVVDDTVTTPQGLRIGDSEEKLNSLLKGEGTPEGYYEFVSGFVCLQVQVNEGVITAMVYKAAAETAGED